MSYPDTLQDEIAHDHHQADEAARRAGNGDRPTILFHRPQWEIDLGIEYAHRAPCICGAGPGQECRGYVPRGRVHLTRMTQLPGNYQAWLVAVQAERKARLHAWLGLS